MKKQILVKALFILLWSVGVCCTSEVKEQRTCKTADESSQEKTPRGQSNEVDEVLKQLNKKTSKLKSFQAQVEYKFIQPLMFDSEKLQKGVFYYAKLDDDSKLRLNFHTSRIDDEKEQKYREEYIVLQGENLPHPTRKFEGIWAVQLNYEMQSVRYIQLARTAEPNKPTDVLDLVNKSFPMIGFSGVEDIKKQFEVTLVEQEKPAAEDFIQVHLKVKPNSVYKDDYVYIDFWIDRKLGLPAKIVTVSTEPATEPVELKDVFEIKFLKPQFNKKIDEKVFDLKIPDGFDKPDIRPIPEKGRQK